MPELRPSHPRAKARWLFVAIGLIAAGCGSSELEADPTFDGVWDVVEIETDSQAIVSVPADLKIEIDTGEAALRGRTDCQQFFGSYTLVDDGGSNGRATFTIPSPAPSNDCSTESQRLHTSLIDALESVTQWRRESSGLTLTSPAGARVELANQVLSTPAP